MKKKTLAAASLLLALLMPLGITPLAVYAEGDCEAQTGISTVGEAPPKMVIALHLRFPTAKPLLQATIKSMIH